MFSTVRERIARSMSLRSVISSDDLGKSLHLAALKYDKRALKRILKSGVSVDYPNDDGQSALFCACNEDRSDVVEALLEFGANVNERTLNGCTPVHAAAFNGNIKIMRKLLVFGGDLRLHDDAGRTPRDWAILQKDPKKRMKMLAFIERIRYLAMTSGKNGLIPKSSSVLSRLRIHTVQSIETSNQSLHHMGFGQVYLKGSALSGMLSFVPFVTQSELLHDNSGPTYNNGPFMVMESVVWKKVKATVKRLHQNSLQSIGDSLINENEFMRQLHHPGILLLMGICQINNLDGIALIYERIPNGSLYYSLHNKLESFQIPKIQEILVQMCEAIIYLHSYNLVHGNITSHAIQIINPCTVKLGNFEYMAQRNSLCGKFRDGTLYNWMAPEVMQGLPADFQADMYGFCSVIWEIFEKSVPWCGATPEIIKTRLLMEQSSLTAEYGNKVPGIFKKVVEYGLEIEPFKRQLDFEQVRKILATVEKNGFSWEDLELQFGNSKDRNEADDSCILNSTFDSNPETGKALNARNLSSYSSLKNLEAAVFDSCPDAKKQSAYEHRQSHTSIACAKGLIEDLKESLEEKLKRNNNVLNSLQPKLKNVSNSSNNQDTDNKICCPDSELEICSNHTTKSSEYEPHSRKPDSFNSQLIANSLPMTERDFSASQNSVNRFSYLGLTKNKADIKPASHKTIPFNQTMGQLTTAGSLFSLYKTDASKQNVSTSMRKTQTMSALPDQKLFYYKLFSQDSEYNRNLENTNVHNLVLMYQKKAAEHKFQQFILDGKLAGLSKTWNPQVEQEETGLVQSLQAIQSASKATSSTSQASEMKSEHSTPVWDKQEHSLIGDFSSEVLKVFRDTVQQRSEEEIEPEEFYFDDEFHPDLDKETHMKLQQLVNSDQTASTSHLDVDDQCTRKKKEKFGAIFKLKKSDSSSFFKKKKVVPSYTTTVRVETNLRNPGRHTITHQTTNLQTGAVHTLFEGTIQEPQQRSTR